MKPKSAGGGGPEARQDLVPDIYPGRIPAGRWSFTQVAHARAPIEEVWSLIGEAGRWKEWSFLTRSGLERPGLLAPDGVGALRRFTAYGVGSREEVLAWEPPTHLSYQIRSGFPIRNHRADVGLVVANDGTTITWSVSFDAKLPGTGAILWVILRILIYRFAHGVGHFAER